MKLECDWFFIANFRNQSFIETVLLHNINKANRIRKILNEKGYLEAKEVACDTKELYNHEECENLK